MVSLAPDGLPEAGLQREDRGLHQQGVQVLRRGGWPQLAGQEGALGGGDRDRRGQHLPMGASEGPLGDIEYTIYNIQIITNNKIILFLHSIFILFL